MEGSIQLIETRGLACLASAVVALAGPLQLGCLDALLHLPPRVSTVSPQVLPYPERQMPQKAVADLQHGTNNIPTCISMVWAVNAKRNRK